MNAGLVARSRASGVIPVGSYASAGGLVGSNQSWTQSETTFAGTVSRSFASGSVTATGWDNNLGGLVGSNDAGSKIIRSSAAGAVIGDGRGTRGCRAELFRPRALCFQ